MDEIIKRLNSFRKTAPKGAAKSELAALEKHLGVTLPNELATLYSDHNGEGDRGELPWRLLSTTESAQINRDLSAEKILSPEIRLFWSDDEGNFAGIYFEGPLAGSICFFDHEERDFAPRFKSLTSFLQAIIAAAEQSQTWREMPSNISSEKTDSQSDPLQQLRNKFSSETNARKRRQLAFDLLAIIPAENSADIIPYLDDPDLHVQERAAETLGRHRHEPAIPLLIQLAQRETTKVHNARIGALLALGRIKTPRSLDALLSLSAAIPHAFHPYIFKALELHGCPIKFENGQWKYQLQDQWRTL
jgi:hypothetical protein